MRNRNGTNLITFFPTFFLSLLATENQFPAIWSEEGKYLASVLGDALVKGLTQVSQERPEDPVEYLANFLRSYGKKDSAPASASAETSTETQRTDSPSEFPEEDIALAAAAATVTTMALQHNHVTSGTATTAPTTAATAEPLEQVEEQTEDPTSSDEPMDQSDEPMEEQPDAEPEGTAAVEEEPAEAETEVEPETEDNPETTTEAEVDEETGQDGTQAETETDVDQEIKDEVKAETEPNEEAAKAEEDAELMKRLDDEVQEQNTEQEDEDAIVVQDDREEEIEGAGQRDDRGQSVLHFAAARPGGSQTLLSFLQNPTTNLAWRDERLKTARDVASGLSRIENVQAIDTYILSRALAGDVETLEKLTLDGYDHLIDVEDANKNNIIDLCEKAGQEGVVKFLKSVPELQEKLENLMYSVRMGDLERVKEYLEEDPRLATAVGKQGRTALHVAVLSEDYPIVQYIAQNFPQALRKGDNLERTPLHYAMGIEKVEKMTRILVRMGAKRVLKDIRGRQPSYYFINREEIAVLQEEEKSS